MGWFVTAIPWTVIGLIWMYLLVWMVLLDMIKLGLYSRLNSDPHKPKWYARFLKGRHAAHLVAE